MTKYLEWLFSNPREFVITLFFILLLELYFAAAISYGTFNCFLPRGYVLWAVWTVIWLKFCIIDYFRKRK